MKLSAFFDETKWYFLACIICFILFPLLNIFLPVYGGLLQTVSLGANLLVIDVTSFLVGYRNFRWSYPVVLAIIYAMIMVAGNVYTPDSVFSSTVYYFFLSLSSAGIGKVISVIKSR